MQPPVCLKGLYDDPVDKHPGLGQNPGEEKSGAAAGVERRRKKTGSGKGAAKVKKERIEKEHRADEKTNRTRQEY